MLKRIATAVLLFWHIAAALSQKLTVKELLSQSNCKTQSCFDSFITTKKFSYFSSHKQQGTSWYVYQADTMFSAFSEPTAAVPNAAIISFYPDGATSCSYRTANLGELKGLKNQLKNLKFIPIDTEKGKKGASTKYRSEAYPSVVVALETNRSGQKAATYQITIYRSFK